jgi:hypothetical protein
LSPGTRAVAEIPLLASNTLVGVLDVQSTEPHAFSQEILNLLETLADQVSTGIQNARLYESEQRRRRLTELLELTGRALSSSLDLSRLPGRVLSLLNTLVPYDRGLLLLREDDKLRPLDTYGFPDDPRLETLALPIQDGDIFQRMVDTSAPIIVGDVSQDAHWHQIPWLPLHHSWLGAPIISKGQVIGMVSLTRQAPQAFSHEDAAWVQSVALQAGIALENASLHAEVTRYNGQLEQMVQARTKALKRANQILERLDSAKSKFINIAAHELRTPLTVIKAYAQVLKNLFQDDGHVQSPESQIATPTSGVNAAKLDKITSGILAGSDRLHEVINSMLDVARIDNQNLKMVRAKTSLAHIIESVCAGFKSDLHARDLSLTLEGLEDLPFIHADHDLLTKVFYHLIINAIKYTPDGGSIVISGRIPARAAMPSPCVEIMIQDTGIGIDPEHQEVIFEKFYQTGEVAFHSSGRTKFKGGGPGLGLAIVRGIVLAHGGEIWVESAGYDEENCPGSRFYVRFPIGRDEAAAKTASAGHDKWGACMEARATHGFSGRDNPGQRADLQRASKRPMTVG